MRSPRYLRHWADRLTRLVHPRAAPSWEFASSLPSFLSLVPHFHDLSPTSLSLRTLPRSLVSVSLPAIPDVGRVDARDDKFCKFITGASLFLVLLEGSYAVGRNFDGKVSDRYNGWVSGGVVPRAFFRSLTSYPVSRISQKSVASDRRMEFLEFPICRNLANRPFMSSVSRLRSGGTGPSQMTYMCFISLLGSPVNA